jgi:hypothetical protein
LDSPPNNSNRPNQAKREKGENRRRTPARKTTQHHMISNLGGHREVKASLLRITGSKIQITQKQGKICGPNKQTLKKEKTREEKIKYSRGGEDWAILLSYLEVITYSLFASDILQRTT